MALPSAITDDKMDYLATLGSYGVELYMLVWKRNIIMRARVNQASFDDSFATITFDNVTEGAYTDAIEGYTCYLSSTDDIRASYISLRLRSDSTAAQLAVEFTSVTVTDDDYIFITKDVPFRMKHPRNSSGTLLVDYDVTYQAPPPAIYNMDTAYYAQIDSDGNADVKLFEPEATAVASGATISSWAWSADGGSFIVGSAVTQDVQLRFTAPGNYKPRVTVTDSNGNTSWFSPFVFVEDANVSSSVVNLNTLGASVTYSVDSGISGNVPFFDGVQNVLDNTFVAIYLKHNIDVGGNKIIFAGRIRNETDSQDYDEKHANLDTVTFDLEGIGTQMAETKNLQWVFQNKASPTTFQQLKDASLWRVVATYLLFMTNLNNSYSLSFDDTGNDFIFREFPIQESNVLDAVMFFMERNKSQFDYDPTGGVKMVRNALFLSTSARSALPTIANWEVEHYSTKSGGGPLWSKRHTHGLRIAKLIMGGGWYNTTSGSVDILAARAPGIVAAGGQETISIDGQVLVANSTSTAASVELKQRAADAFASVQDIDVLSTEIPDVFASQLSPSVANWYTHTMPYEDNIRGDIYTTATRWLLTEMTVNVDIESGRPLVSTVFQVETADLGYGIIVERPPVAASYSPPVLYLAPAIGGFPENLGNSMPTGYSVIFDSQGFTPEEQAQTNSAIDPKAAAINATIYSGDVRLEWTASGVFIALQFTQSDAPEWKNTGIAVTGGETIKQACFDRFTGTGRGAYAVSNNDNIAAPKSTVYINYDLPNGSAWRATTIEGTILAEQIIPTKADSVMIYGKTTTFVGATWTINQLSGNGTDYLVPETEGIDITGSDATGIYVLSTDIYTSLIGDGGGSANNINFKIYPGVTVTSIEVDMEANRSGTTSGDRISNIVHIAEDGTQTPLANTTYGAGTYFAQPRTFGAFGLSITDGRIVIATSIDKLPSPPPPGGRINIVGVEIIGTSEAEHAATMWSSDRGQIFDIAYYKDVGLMTLGDGSMSVRFGQTVYAAKDEKIKKAPLTGQGYIFDADQGDTAGQYAMALLRIGGDDYLLAPDGGVADLYKIIADVQTDISSGAGYTKNIGGLAMINQNSQDIWMLGDDNKVGYSNDQGDSSWVLTDVPATATWISVNVNAKTEFKQVYVTAGATVLYSNDAFATFVTKIGPSIALLGGDTL